MTMKAKTMKVGRRTIKYYSDNFEYFQPNSHICGDCTIRAIAKATNSSWYTVFDALVPIARELQMVLNEREVADKYLKSIGFTWVPIKVERGEKRPTVSGFAKVHQGTYVLSVAGHLTSCKDGKFYDIWDCGAKSMYGYWVKK